jgi:orotidine-5'-phosphate decarboxylase
MVEHFGDALIGRVRELGHPLCVGLDPYLDRIPEIFRAGDMAANDPATADAVEAFCRAVIDRLAGKVAVVKPQSAFFELMGWRGMRALENVIRHASEAGLLVIMDAKRGDIGSTAEGYAATYLDPGAPFEADSLTCSPYLGRDTLDPYMARVRDHGRGIFVLVKTSNPGSGDFQDLKVGNMRLSQKVAAALSEVAESVRGPKTGWSSLGGVIGATYPGEAERLRELMPNMVLLIPGYGTQGAGPSEALASFVAGPKGREGGVVSSSRAVLFPEGAETADAAGWDQAFDAGLERAIKGLRQAL